MGLTFRKDIITKTYWIKQNFYLDIVKTMDDENDIPIYEAWIYDSTHGIKMSVIGMDINDITFDDFLALFDMEYLTKFMNIYASTYMH